MLLTRTADNVPPKVHDLRSTFEIYNPWFRSFVQEIRFAQNAEGPVAVGLHIASKSWYLLGCRIDIRGHDSKITDLGVSINLKTISLQKAVSTIRQRLYIPLRSSTLIGHRSPSNLNFPQR